MSTIGETRVFEGYYIGQRLGKGGQGKVFLCSRREPDGGCSPTWDALKIIPLTKLTGKSKELLETEIKIMENLHHDNIIRWMRYIPEGAYTKKNTGEVIKAAGLIFEVASGGELFNYLMKGPFPEKIAKFYFRQLIDAIGFAHANGVAHRDLKPENLLLNSDFNLKVIDFGMAKMKHGGEGDKFAHTYVGTQTYMPPEVAANTRAAGYDPKAMDIWACGVLLFIFCFGAPPITKPDSTCWFMQRIQTNKWDHFWKGHQKYAANEACRALMENPTLREVIQGMLCYDPLARMNADKVLRTRWYQDVPAGLFEVAADMGRRKREIERDQAEEALRKLAAKNRARAADGDFKAMDLDTHRGLEDEDLAAPLPEGFSREGRFFDMYSDKPASVISLSIEEAAKSVHMKCDAKAGNKYKLTMFSEEGESVVFNTQVFYDSASNLHLLTVDRREGKLINFQKAFGLFQEAVADIIAAPPS